MSALPFDLYANKMRMEKEVNRRMLYVLSVRVVLLFLYSVNCHG